MKINLNEYFDSHKPKNGKFFTVAIDGRGGAGKTNLGFYLQTILKDFLIINGDDYFEPVKDQIVWGAFNDERFIKDVIDPIKTSNHFVFRPYNWEDGEPYLEEPMTIERGIIIERCYSFGFDIDWDLKIWVETPKEKARERGMARETMPKERVRLAWETVWQPTESAYIAKNHPLQMADLVISGTDSYEEQLD